MKQRVFFNFLMNILILYTEITHAWIFFLIHWLLRYDSIHFSIKFNYIVTKYKNYFAADTPVPQMLEQGIFQFAVQVDMYTNTRGP